MALKNIFKKEWFLIGLILILSFATRFYNFGYPKEIVFDELYFAQFATDYFSGEYYFDIHPPLAKLIMAGSAKIVGADLPTDFDFQEISQEYPDNSYKVLRFIVGIFGVLLPLAVYFLSKELFKKKMSAVLAAVFIILENALLVQSRVILMDIMLLVFGVLGLTFLFVARRKQKFLKYLFLVLSGIFLSAAISVKWTALVFLGVAGAILLFDLISKRKFKEFLLRALLIGVVAILFYFGVFVVHFKLLSKSGDGDVFMTPQFRKTLVDSDYYDNSSIKPLGMVGKFIELNVTMYSANAGLSATHPYGSTWYSWPVLYRPIYYWYHDDGVGQASRIYLQGNPFIWWFGLAVVLYSLFWFVVNLFKKNKEKDFWIIGLLLLGYFANLLPYILVTRVAFLYHYFPSLIFLIILSGYFIEKHFRKQPLVLITILSLVFISFMFFAPLSYGTSLPEQIFNSKIWFKSWL